MKSVYALAVHAMFCSWDSRHVFSEKECKEVSDYFTRILFEIGCQPIRSKVLSDHVHLLFGLNVNQPLARTIQHIKGTSSHWINQEMIVPFGFKWSRGYGAMCVSPGDIRKLSERIDEQEEYHRRKSFRQELEELFPVARIGDFRSNPL